MTLNSCLYVGKVRHRRFTPVQHHFNYPLLMLYVDLDEWAQLGQQSWFLSLQKFNLVSVYRADYLRHQEADLKQAVLAKLAEHSQQKGEVERVKKVYMLSQPRYLGIVFNPLSLYYCFDEENTLVAVLADVSNTPWNERHPYVLWMDEAKQTVSSSTNYALQNTKCFHVSPFNPLDMKYHWKLSTPGEKLMVHIENHLPSEEEQHGRHFDATINAVQQPFSSLGKWALRYPLMTLQVVAGIYWHALRLWLKGAPIYDHPEKSKK